MEIFGGFMVMMSIISLFLAVVWLIMPFVVFAIKGKQDRTLEVLEVIEGRLAALETRTRPVEAERNKADPAGQSDSSAGPSGGSSDGSSDEHSAEKTVTVPESVADNKRPEASPVE